MSRQNMFWVLAAIVCIGTLTLVTTQAAVQDRPLVYPDSDPPELDAVNQIPESLLIQMKDIQNVTQLLDFLGTSANSGIGGRRPINGSASLEPESLNGTVDRRKLNGGMDISKAAGCEPEMVSVELEKPDDPTHVYWPMCVRVARCGGCCTSSLLSCVPVKTSKFEAKVLHAQYLGDGAGTQFDVIGVKSFKMEKHERCSCKCKETAEDCTPLQEYRMQECRCMCTNLQERELCTGSQWIWDPKDCACKCREIEDCSTGFFYNGLTCRCESKKTSLVGRRLPVNASLIDPSVSQQDTNANVTNNKTTVPTITTTVAADTTTTSTPLLNRRPMRVRPRLGLPLVDTVGERVPHKASHVGIRPSDYEDDSAPFTMARSEGKEKSRRVQSANVTLTTQASTPAQNKKP